MELNKMKDTASLLRQSSCYGLLSTSLLQALQDEDLPKFIEALNDENITSDDVNHVYPAPHYGTILDMAIDKGLHQFVTALLSNSLVNVNLRNAAKKQSPIHSVIDNDNFYILKLLLKHGVDINVKNEFGRTPFHLLVKKDWTFDTQEALQLLLENDVRYIDEPDTKGYTPLHFAVNKQNLPAIKYLVNNGADLNKPSPERRQTALDLMKNKLPVLYKEYSENPPQVKTAARDPTNELWSAIQSRNIEEFKNILQKLPDVDYFHGHFTCLQYACDNGLGEFVELLKDRANLNLQNPNNQQAPLHYAASHGDLTIIKTLINSGANPNIVDSMGLTPLHIVVKQEHGYERQYSQWNKCIEFLLSVGVNVNISDITGNTPLHFATLRSDSDTIMKLLKSKADFTLANDYGETPIDRIPTESMREFFDSYIKGEDSSSRDNKAFTVTFDYSFLQTPQSNTDVEKGRKPGLHEAQSLWFMMRSKLHQSLLKHPLIESFLQLKWQRCRHLYFANIVFYFSFVLLLTGYMLGLITEAKKELNPKDESLGYMALRYILLILNTGFAVREIFQFIISPMRYIFFVENLAEWTMIICLYYVLIMREAVASNHVAAIALFFAWVELVLLLGRLQQFSVSVFMFQHVSWSFIKMLIWYSLFILGFAFSYYVLFSFDAEGDFTSIRSTIIKTIVMMTGEFDYGALPINEYPVAGSLLFLLFLFFITIVLLNLLVGLAVADTQEIRKQAEIITQLSQLKLISYMEAMFFGDPFSFLSDYPPFKWIPSPAPCKWITEKSMLLEKYLHWVGKSTLLFQNCLSHNVSVRLRPNQPCVVGNNLKISTSVVKEAKLLVLERLNNEPSTDEKVTSVLQRLGNIEKQMILLQNNIYNLNAIVVTKS